MKAFWGMVIMVVGLGCMIFTGGCSLGLWHETKQSFFLYTGFLPFLFSCYMVYSGFRIIMRDVSSAQNKQHHELSQELQRELVRPYKSQPDEGTEKSDSDPDFFNEPN